MAVRTVLLSGLPQMAEDILASLLESHPDLKVIRGGAADNLAAAASAAKAEVVVVTRSDPADLDAVDPALARAASLSILALTPGGASAYLHKISCETSRLENAAEAVLAALVTADSIR